MVEIWRATSVFTRATVAGSPDIKADEERIAARVSIISVEAASEEPFAISNCTCAVTLSTSVFTAFDDIVVFVLCREAIAAVIADSVVEKICCADEAFCWIAEEAMADEA